MATIISTSSSSTIAETDIARVPIEFTFDAQNGNTLVKNISDELLDTEERAEARAHSEFLQNSFRRNVVKFKTYITEIKLNNVVDVEGLPYLAKDILISIDNHKMVLNITGVRYD